MVKTSNVVYKTLVIGIIILFIGMSVVSSIGNIVDNIPSYTQILDVVDNSQELLSRGKIAYAYIAYPGPEGPCYFDLNDPGTLTRFDILNCPGFCCGTWTNNGKWLVCDETGALWEINLCNRTALKIGGGGVSLTSLSYNPVNDKLYGVTSSDLYEINMSTGEQTYIGSFGLSGKLIIAIAINIEGRAFIWDILFTGDSTFWEVDLETSEATEVGSMGENLCYAQDGAFDWKTGILWLAAYSSTGFLATVDIDSGELTHMGDFEGGAELCSLAIPHADDFCPPQTTISLNPPEPDGLNGWYVSDVNVTLTATDDISGVKEIRYTINGGPEGIIPGDNGTFILHDDGDDILVEYWAIDNAGNVERKNHFLIDIDQTKPEIELCYEVTGGNWWQGWEFTFTATATDVVSGVEKVLFYFNGDLQETVYGPGPYYQWLLHLSGLSNNTFKVRGIILNPEITDENVSFYAIIVRISATPLDKIYIRACAFDYAGNMNCAELLEPCLPLTITFGIYLFQNLTLPNNYEGHIGKFLIFATFNSI